jgi:hypothetical protein
MLIKDRDQHAYGGRMRNRLMRGRSGLATGKARRADQVDLGLAVVKIGKLG